MIINEYDDFLVIMENEKEWREDSERPDRLKRFNSPDWRRDVIKHANDEIERVMPGVTFADFDPVRYCS